MTTTKPRSIGDAISYAIAHGTRIEVLELLNEGVRSQSEIAKELGIPMSNLQHHVAELLNSGSIEVVDTRWVGNVQEHLYRALRRGEYSAEDYAEMDEVSRKTVLGLTLQNLLAEHLGGFRSGDLRGEDPNVVLFWDWFNVDALGEEEIRLELEGSWQRLNEIAARAAVRTGKHGAKTRPVVVSSIAHPRSRPVRAKGRPPHSTG